MIDLTNDIRPLLDRMARYLVNGLIHRAEYHTNFSIFSDDSSKGKPLFRERLEDEIFQDQRRYGRYEFHDQFPLLVPRSALPKPEKSREIPAVEILPVDLDHYGQRVVDLYQKWVGMICKPGETPAQYGEIARLDVDNVLRLYERINLGRFVAESKLQSNPSWASITDRQKLSDRFRNPGRERKVIEWAVTLARSYQPKQDDEDLPILDPEIMRTVFRDIIDITMSLETDYTIGTREQRKLQLPPDPASQHYPRGPGWGTVPMPHTRGIGWGQS